MMYLRRKKDIKKLLVLLFSIAFLILLNGCESKEQAQGISFQEDTVTVEKYETYSLKLLGIEDEEVEWKSKDKDIATVQDGVVCGRKKGNTEILAYIGKAEVSCNVVVTDNQYVPVIELGESDDLIMDKDGIYTLQPSLSYNGNMYTDAEYSFSSEGDAIEVDETGVITSSEFGEGMVCVEAKWRGNVIETSLAVEVIDMSTTIEVSDKVYNIYLNGAGEDYPPKVDLGISIFDKDVPIKEQAASVKYVEKPMENDVEGAATVKNGVAYAAQYGTTHFVAEYTSLAGDVVRSTMFTINVLQTPADKYSVPIEGKEFEFFIEPLNPDNSVEWDEDIKAFHLINQHAEHDDSRGFVFNKEYLENIIKYTDADSIKFEFKTDGIPSGASREDEAIYLGFYPEWFDAANLQRYELTEEWTEVEIFFDDIPRDSEGNLKTIFLLNTVEGLYVRNIRLVPKYTGPYLYMDFEINTTGGDWKDDIEIGFVPHSYEGSINDCQNRVTVTPGKKQQLKLRLDDLLVDGELPGFGFVVYGGPEWDDILKDGVTPDRTTINISNVRIKGSKTEKIDLSVATWTSGTDAGFTDANGSGIASYSDGVVTISDGFRFDGHKVTFGDPEDAKNITYLCMDMGITTTSGDWTEPIQIGFVPHSFEGDINDCTNRIVVTADKNNKIKLKLDDLLVDGELPGFGFIIYGGPEWNDVCADGFTPDRTTITITNVRLEGAKKEAIDLNNAIWTNGTNAGYTNANGSGIASYSDGVVTISNGFRFDGHKVTFEDPEEAKNTTYLCMDMGITTTNGDWTEPIQIGFVPHSFEGDINDCTNRVVVTADKNNKIKLKIDDLLVDGELPGFGLIIYGGPEWDDVCADGVTPDRTTITITNVRLEGARSETIDLSTATWVNGTNAGYTNANSSGIASYRDGVVTITDGFRYDGHKVTFEAGEQTGPSNPVEPEEETYLCMDMKIDTTAGNWTDIVQVEFFNHSYEGTIGTSAVRLNLNADQTSATEIRLNLNDFLVNGALPGFKFVVLGGPEWDAKCADGYTPNRTTITISNVRLEGSENKAIDLDGATWVKGANAGFTNANDSGVASYSEGVVSITDGFRFDGHMVTFGGSGTTEEVPKLRFDVTATVNDNGATDELRILFFNHAFEGRVDDVTNGYEQYIAANGTTTVEMDLEHFLVDGEVPGFGFGILNGPEWSAPEETRTTLKFENVQIVDGNVIKDIDLSTAIWTKGVETGITDSNSFGNCSYSDGVAVITNIIRYDAHEVTFEDGEQTEPSDPVEPEEETYLCMDMKIDTTAGNWTDIVQVEFFNHSYEGDIGTSAVRLNLNADQTSATEIRLNLNDFLVDGVLPGFKFVILGGPEWNATCEDGTSNRTTTTISNVRLEGGENKVIDLDGATWVKGANAGFTNANNSGVVSYNEGVVSITDGFRFDGHMVTFGGSGTTEEVPKLRFDVTATVNDNGATDELRILFFNHTFEGRVDDATNGYEQYIAANGTTTVEMDLEHFLVDGEVPGFGFGILSGPEWSAPEGTRTTLKFENVQIVDGDVIKDVDLSTAIWTKGVETGITDSNSFGNCSYSDGVAVITNIIRYDAHEVTFGEEEEAEIFLCMDMKIDTTAGDWADIVQVEFFNYSYEGDIGTSAVRLNLNADQTSATEIRLNLNDFLVDGELPGFKFVILGGPEWNATCEDGTSNRTTTTISNVRLEGGVNKTIDLEGATWVNGTNAGFTNANGSGAASYSEGAVSITNGFRFDGHKVTFAKAATTDEPVAAKVNWLSSMRFRIQRFINDILM